MCYFGWNVDILSVQIVIERAILMVMGNQPHLGTGVDRGEIRTNVPEINKELLLPCQSVLADGRKM